LVDLAYRLKIGCVGRTIRFTAGIKPIGAELQDPVTTWVPLVRGNVVVAQKFMKLLLDVRDPD
jgi:hypothetical protein